MVSAASTASSVMAAAAGLVLLFAAIRKLGRRVEFSRTIVEIGAPPVAASPVALSFALVEGLAGLLLATAQTPRAASILGLAVSTMLIAVAIYAWSRHLEVGCSCFGTRHRTLGRSTLPLSTTLLAAQVPLFLFAITSHVEPVRWSALPLFWACASGVILLALWVETSKLVLDLRRQRRTINRLWESYARLG